MLLVDDLVDSRWTLTIAGATLLEAGSGLISPFLLAKSVSDLSARALDGQVSRRPGSRQ